MNRHVAALAVAGSLVLCGCTFSSVRPESQSLVATKSYTVAIVGPVTGTDVLWNSYAIEMRRQLITALRESHVFTQVLDETPAAPPPQSAYVTAQIIDVHKGSAVARVLVGFGAGRAYMTADVQVKDPSGAQLYEAAVKKTYAGGLGIGGAGLVDMDDMSQKLGDETAVAIEKWTGVASAR